MTKEIFPPVWDEKIKQWVLRIKNDDGSIQRILFESDISLKNYIYDLVMFQQTLRLGHDNNNKR